MPGHRLPFYERDVPESVTHGHHHISAVRGLAASVIFVVMLLAALCLWTAIPLGWIWIGSKVSETQFPAEGPYAVVAIGILFTTLADAWLIGTPQRGLRTDHRHQPARADAAELAEEHARHAAPIGTPPSSRRR